MVENKEKEEKEKITLRSVAIIINYCKDICGFFFAWFSVFKFMYLFIGHAARLIGS